MQRDLGDLEQLWSLAVQSAGFGVWDLDCVGQKVRYSPQWKVLLGYAGVDEAEPTSVWRNRVHPDDLAPMLAALGRHLRGENEAYEAEFRLRTAAGAYRWLHSRGRVVERNAQGEALRMVGTLTDETDRHEVEALRLARDRAEAATRAKTVFLSRMSHELRTPLNAVLGFAQLLAGEIGQADIDTQRSRIAHIEQAGWQLLQMIEGVLDMSRAESGQLVVDIEAVALAPLWQSVCDALGPAVQRRGLVLSVAPLPAHAAVLADPARLRQVLASLLGNAVKYNREGGSVHFAAVAEAGARAWRLVVTDTGPGIAAEQMPHLFEPFNRLGRDGSAIEGVGIGLALSRWLVERMGGRIGVQSEPGVGTTVSVTLPAAAAA